MSPNLTSTLMMQTHHKGICKLRKNQSFCSRFLLLQHSLFPGSCCQAAAIEARIASSSTTSPSTEVEAPNAAGACAYGHLQRLSVVKRFPHLQHTHHFLGPGVEPSPPIKGSDSLEIQSCGLEEDVPVATCLVDFYGRCGSMEAAKMVFNSISARDLCSWNALLSGYSQTGDWKRSLEMFERMKEKAGVVPNEITLTHLLSACNHGADSQRQGVPGGDAEQWKNVEVGKIAYERLVELDEKDPTSYVLMANIFGSVGMVEERDRVKIVCEVNL
ncbi:pentatricopeptide repeat-containing protein At1g11290, chloroplastic-like [Selaginella moellendorffii]|uniref:pentatricopeptide repeat-containing protein At1g11290, chloroplastic-like n=1 Tax=Selaginella moellendorffii TaxID=88036 RepID=UPI000D1CA95B|nr:pentatricopeptide repeat-containing protein At1g11290, chloroplastic-like [Selaginella moellendorffii]|eukprot:XP_024519275.1 pentatricopeptide repeat-containing protein At1g11290, chloroplastic-like [Selaginella moellendorffii]